MLQCFTEFHDDDEGRDALLSLPAVRFWCVRFNKESSYDNAYSKRLEVT